MTAKRPSRTTLQPTQFLSVAGLAAVGAAYLSDALHWHPPGPLFPVFAVTACASVPVEATRIPEAFALAAASAAPTHVRTRARARLAAPRIMLPERQRPGAIRGAAGAARGCVWRAAAEGIRDGRRVARRSLHGAAAAVAAAYACHFLFLCESA